MSNDGGQKKSSMLANWGWRFEIGFKEVSIAYRASVMALERQRMDAEQFTRSRLGLEPDQPIPQDESDPDGPTFSDFFWEEVGEFEQEADGALDIVRIAFLIGLFHFWERQSNRWVDTKHYDHERVMEWLRQHGQKPDKEALSDLKLAANCAKHGPGQSCTGLYNRRPDLFEAGEDNASPTFEPNDQTLRITAETLKEFFDAARAAGPKARRPWDNA